MVGKVAEIKHLLSGDALAGSIVTKWDTADGQRQEKIGEWRELRNYVFATDTTKTTNSKLPWKNKTTLPKLAQIRDNLHSNYISALFPNDNWMRWEGYSTDSETAAKKKAITSYMSNKLREQDFRTLVSRLLYDYIDYGNAFADCEWVEEYKEDQETGEMIPGYIGPKAKRWSPYDIVFNPAAPDFNSSWKITRVIKTVGELKEEIQTNPEHNYLEDALRRAEEVRSELQGYNREDINKAEGYAIDGFGSMSEYYESGYVELLIFEGNLHDIDSGDYLRDHVVVVMDRKFVLMKEPNKKWYLGSSKVHGGWRLRPDNIYAMGPLDNLVGMQYRIDHLENLKADVFDLIAHPPLKIQGNVEEFVWEPNAEIYMGDDGNVDMLRPDTTALNADMQINILEQKMEEMAGAPKQAMGIRTPGEKTAYEVQQLENAAGRIFQEKITNFEIEVLEPLLNNMLELARRNLDGADLVRVMDDDLGVVEFMNITKEDITAKGKLRPVGARHFAAKAQLLQNLTGTFNSQIGQMIANHVSSKQLAKLVEDVLGIERFGLIRDNVGLMEQAESAKLMNSLQEQVDADSMTPTGDEDNVI